jgi:DNA-binding XRE family transcriptional regulator
LSVLKLRMLRIDRGMSPEALGELAGVTGATIRRLEDGGLPTAGVAFKVAQVFDMKPSELWPELVDQRVA